MPLAPFAARPANTKGRAIPEPPSPGRSVYQRDRDRVVHSTAFRRLEYKTQVFLNHEGDHFRTRLTHSIEVAQLARTVARMLRVEEDLTEAISLAHDLGHTPFGHAGQDALNHCMKQHGGFEHNLQSLRVVSLLEQRYPAWDGLNLSFETLEGILKHCSIRNARKLGELGERFIARQQPGLEAQIANLADQVAYTGHDIDDGLRSGLLELDAVLRIPLIAEQWAEVRKQFAQLDERRAALQMLRQLVDTLVRDMVHTTRTRLSTYMPASIDEVRRAPPLVGFSPAIEQGLKPLRSLLFKRLYRHPRVLEQMQAAQRVIAELFDAYCAEPAQMPEQHSQRARGVDALQRTVADYIAGMTDRYALREHERLFGPQVAQALTMR
jgi:dGTPase